MAHIGSLTQKCLIASFVGLLAACSTTTVQQTSTEVVAQSQDVAPYRLGNGDQLRVTVFGQDDLSGQFEVDGTGSIAMPLIGQISAINLTTLEFEARLKQALDGDYLVNPRVSVEVVNYRPYYILGEVGNPGEYPYSSGLTVMNAVASAGGFTYRANRKVVFIKHKDAAEEVAITLDSNTVVKPGDTLRLKERFF